MEIRQPAVAGAFYPDSPMQLRQDLATLLDGAGDYDLDAGSIKALIVPHAGYVYSGPVAATAYKLLSARRDQIRRVVLLGPSHRVPFRGLALPTASQFRTPLGDIPLDTAAMREIANLPGVQIRDDAHDWEHSLEVQLPFLQTIFSDFQLVPVVVGDAEADTVARVIEQLWGGEETLIVISSDLSHFLPYEQAWETDDQTTRLIEQQQDAIAGDQACGCRPLNGLLRITKRRGLRVLTLDVRNSGDTAGPRDQVVGYGSYAICQ